MLLYLSGKMTGLPGHGYDTFHRAAEDLRLLGFDVLNPAETAGGVTHLPRETFMAIDAGYVQAADAVVVMPPLWLDSRGAKLEAILCQSLSKPVYLYDPERGLGDEIEITDWHVEYRVLNTALEYDGPGGCAA